MSRSYKKIPYCGDRKGKIKKRFANKTVRSWLKQHPENSLNGSKYKKVYCQYDICDYYTIISWEEFFKNNKEYNYKKLPEKEFYKDLHRYWYKHYKAK